jgi:ELWxxDGT repeat protein
VEQLAIATIGVDERFFVLTEDIVHNGSLWLSDGTAEGTLPLSDVMAQQIRILDHHQLVQMDGVVYFAADDQATGYELWRTDGTAAGTYMLKDICLLPYVPPPIRLT